MFPKLVSFVIPTHNRAALLAVTLESVLSQTHREIEVLVVDDGSTDDTAAMLGRIADARVRSIRLEQARGANHARNLGLEQARGEFVCFMDSDDLLHPEKTAEQVRMLSDDPGLDFCVCQTTLFTDEPGDATHLLNRLEPEDFLDRIIRHDIPWQTNAPLYRTAFARRAGPWNEALICWQDVDFHLRALLLGPRIGVDPRPLNYHRLNRSGSISYMGMRRYQKGVRAALESMWKNLEAAHQLNPEREAHMRSQVWTSARASAFALHPSGVQEAAALARERGSGSKAGELIVLASLAYLAPIRGLYSIAARLGVRLPAAANFKFWTAPVHALLRALGLERPEVRWWRSVPVEEGSTREFVWRVPPVAGGAA